MVLDSDRRLGPGTVTVHLIWPATTFSGRWSHSKQMTADFAALDFAALNTTVCEHIDLFSRCCRLGQLHAGFHRDAGPRIRNVLVELLLIKSMHDPPSFATEKHAVRNLGPFGPSVRRS